MIRPILITIFLNIQIVLCAQITNEVIGVVKNSQGKPIPSAIIILSYQDGNMLQYGVSDSNGKYTLNYKNITGTFLITVRSIGYLPHESSIVIHKDSLIYKDFTLKKDVKILEEIVIQRPSTEPDSVNIEIDNLGLHENSTLKDILSKHPSFSVSDAGTILYKGKIIDKININNKPAFIYQNKIALDILEKKIIKDLTVNNNSRDQFTLGFEDQRETLLNINTKEDMKNTILGEVEKAYGLSKKFEIKGKLLFFSKPINTFFTHSTNNFGSHNLEVNEINNMFNSKSNFSEVESGLINNLFETNIARFKDFRSTSTITIRHEKEKYRLHSTTYYLLNNRGSNQSVSNITPNGTLLLSQNSTNIDNFNSILNKNAIDWKVSKNELLGYKISINSIWNQDNVNNITNLYNSGIISENPIQSNGKIDNIRVSQEVYYTNLLGKKILLNNSVGYEYSSINHYSEIFQKDNQIIFRNPQIQTSNLTASSKLQYKYKISIMPWMHYQLKYSNQNATEYYNKTLYNREFTLQELKLGVSGENVYNYLKYNADLGLNIYSLNNRLHRLIPYNFNIDYEKRLLRLYGGIKRQYYVNDISFAIDRITNYTDVTIGNSNLIGSVNYLNTYELGYSYNNLFKGKSWGLVFNIDHHKNNLGYNLSSIDEQGTRYLEARVIPNTQLVSLDLNGSKRIFSSKFPMSLKGSIGYQKNINTSFYNHQSFNITQYGPKVSLTLESLSSSWLNFILKSNVNLFRVSSLNQVFDSQSIKSSLEVITREGNFEGRVGFIGWVDNLYGNTYYRKNLFVNFEYKRNKYSFGIRGRNIDDFIPIFDNNSFNNYAFTNQGVNTIVQNNQAIRYMLIFFKYRFK